MKFSVVTISVLARGDKLPNDAKCTQIPTADAVGATLCRPVCREA